MTRGGRTRMPLRPLRSLELSGITRRPRVMWQGRYFRNCTRPCCKVIFFQKRWDRCRPLLCHVLRSRNRKIGTSCDISFQRTSQIRTRVSLALTWEGTYHCWLGLGTCPVVEVPRSVVAGPQLNLTIKNLNSASRNYPSRKPCSTYEKIISPGAELGKAGDGCC